MTEHTVGKLPPRLLERTIFRYCGASRPEVLVGPGIGEDAALIRWPVGQYVAVASDPIVGAREGAGRFLVHVNANDIACKGGEPAFLVVTLLVPSKGGAAQVEAIMREIHEACLLIGAAVVGGHTELTARYDQPVLVGTMMGPTKYAYRATDIRPGDAVVLTKHTGLEGMAILANDRPDLLRGVLNETELSEVRSWLDHISVLGESRILRDLAKFLHDPTEGGVGGGVAEIMRLSGLGVDLDVERVPLSPLTRRAADHLGFDPLHLISSGVLMAVVPREREDGAMERLRAAGIDGVIAGRMTDGPGNAPDNVAEELWGLLERPEGGGQ